jgi:hypothetical protein
VLKVTQVPKELKVLPDSLDSKDTQVLKVIKDLKGLTDPRV